MCLVLFSYQPETECPLVVAANRDEFYARPARSAHYWDDRPNLLAGRDLSAQGTWLGVSRTGRFATVTNFAEDSGEAAPRSRGELPELFLAGTASAHDFAHHVDGPQYRGFNLLLWDGQQLVYSSNRGTTQDLPPGTYGLANAELGASWPKVVRGVEALDSLLDDSTGDGPLRDRLLALLADDSAPPDELLPRRGRPLELERRVAPCFIRGTDYGTRASTAVIMGRNQICFAEQGYGPGGALLDRADFHLPTI